MTLWLRHRMPARLARLLLHLTTHPNRRPPMLNYWNKLSPRTQDAILHTLGAALFVGGMLAAALYRLDH